MENYTEEDRDVWRKLFERQAHNLTSKASPEYLQALWEMRTVLNAENVPDFARIDGWFDSTTGWKIKCVPGLIPVEDFFQLLAEKHFCSSTWLRSPAQLDYLEEPDMFHDIFGHVPLLSNPVFSEFMQQFGALGVRVLNDPQRILMLQRLYWFTIEFGLIENAGGEPLIYGAGIASSFGESNHALSHAVERRPFDLWEIIETPFITDEVQTRYFVVEDFDQLFTSLAVLAEKWNVYALV